MTAAVGLLYLAVIELLHWNTQPDVLWSGLLIILFVGALFENAIQFEAITEQDAPAGLAGASTDADPTFNAGLLA